MNLLRSLFTKAEQQPTYMEGSLYPGTKPLEVVGESHHQDTLWKIVGGLSSEPIRHQTHAVLVPDPHNSHDPNAIKVLVDGLHVGYLPRDAAKAYRPGLLELMARSTNHAVVLQAEIVGGGQRPDGLGLLGVFLSHDPADFGLTVSTAATARSSGGFRTGFSTAAATDAQDDRYDLSWYRDLSPDNVAAIKQLRSDLAEEREVIDRHYMFLELERRLYKCRDVFSSALEEYDSVCRQHYAEMAAIKPALLEKFGAVPVIDTYRQAAIRCKKAHDWRGMHEWAECGLSVYGEEAARVEAVEDLRKQLAYATAKLRSKQPDRAGMG